MDIKQYKDRVSDFFKSKKVTKKDWDLLGEVFLEASENGQEGLDEFDKKILTEQEYKDTCMIE